MKLVSLVFWASLLGGCASAPRLPLFSHQPVRELSALPQSFSELELKSQIVPLVTEASESREKQFREAFFAPWFLTGVGVTLEELEKEITGYRGSYGENYQPRSDEWVEAQRAQANLGQRNRLHRAGVIVRTTDLRVLPTELPCFRDPNGAGEGYPFDYAQFSRLYTGTPVFLSHASTDGDWMLVETGSGVHGWVRASDVGSVSAADVKRVSRARLGVFVEEGRRLLGPQRIPRYSALGMVVPVEALGEKTTRVLLPGVEEGVVSFRAVGVPTEWLRVGGLRLDRAEDLATAYDRFFGRPYGWGSLLGNRDCSALTKDFFALFNILLPPASDKQMAYGELTDVSGLTPAQKVEKLREKGRPFRTLVYQRGHIGIYVGSYQGTPLVYQALWGIRTRRGSEVGRTLVARAIVARIDFAKHEPEFDAERGTLLDKMSSFAVLAP